MDQLTSGAIAMGFSVAGLFFLRFWRETQDRLFILFALGFFLMGANRVFLAVPGIGVLTGREEQYWVRFLAFALILLAVLDKNRPRRARSGPNR